MDAHPACLFQFCGIRARTHQHHSGLRSAHLNNDIGATGCTATAYAPLAGIPLELIQASGQLISRSHGKVIGTALGEKQPHRPGIQAFQLLISTRPLIGFTGRPIHGRNAQGLGTSGDWQQSADDERYGHEYSTFHLQVLYWRRAPTLIQRMHSRESWQPWKIDADIL